LPLISRRLTRKILAGASGCKTKVYGAQLVFHKKDIEELSAQDIMTTDWKLKFATKGQFEVTE